MAYPYSLVATRVAGEVLTAAKYNADHQNHIDNNIPTSIDDHSTDLTQMRLQTNPGEVGFESLATTVAGEIERIRYALAQAKGTQYWYQSGGFHSVARLATGGTGTSGDPYTGWETAVNALAAGSSIYFPPGYYTQTVQITMKQNWEVWGANPAISRINVNGAIKGWVYTAGTLTEHANIRMHHLGLYGDGTNTLALVDINQGFHYDFEKVYLWNSSTDGLVAKGFIFLNITDCDIEGNDLCGARLGGAGGSEYAICFTINGTLFGAAAGVSSDGYVKLTQASTGWIGMDTTFEYGTRDIVLDSVTDLVINNVFGEQGTENCIQSLGVCQRVEIANSHFHTNKQGAAVYIDLSDGTDAHEDINIHHNRFLAFGGSGQTSWTLFHPGDTRSFKFEANEVMPESARGTFVPAIVYVDGFFADDNANFRKDILKYDTNNGAQPMFIPGIGFQSGTAALTYDAGTDTLTLTAPQATESLQLIGASSEILLEDLAITLSTIGDEAAKLDNNATGGQTRLLLWDVTAGALKRVAIETADLGTGSKSYLHLV